jgi:hypothetical protein
MASPNLTKYYITSISGSSTTLNGITHAYIKNTGSANIYIEDSNGNQFSIDQNQTGFSFSAPNGMVCDLIINPGSSSAKVIYFK